jgi:putative transcriptional regulator
MENKVFKNLSGKILIASPYTLYGNIFYKSLIYVLMHSNEGAVGLVLNRVVPSAPIPMLFKTLAQGDAIKSLKLPLHIGGPMELDRVFLLHSDDYDKNLLFKFKDNLAISSNTEILKDIAAGNGPADSLFMLGYTSWRPGEMESELENNFWIISDLDKELVFSKAHEYTWDIALKNLGITGRLFTSTIGHA